MQRSLFRTEAVEHQKDALHGEVLIIPSLSHKVITTILLLWVLAVAAWLFSSSYARQETVTGWLEPPSGIVRVYASNSTGKIKQILVEEGERVTSGQPLVIVNGDRILENGDNLEKLLLDEYESQRALLSRQIESSMSIHSVKLKDVEQQIEASKQDLVRLDEQISTVKQRHDILSSRVQNSLVMNQKGHISDVEYEAKIEQELAVRSEYQSLMRSQVNQINRIEQLDTQLELMPKEQQDIIAQINSALSDIAQKIAQLHGQQAHVVKATVDGVVTNLQVRTGQQASSTVPLMSIVPENAILEAKILVPVRAAGFVRSGQELTVRYDAFPYQKFGLYSGTIDSISSTIILPNEIKSLPVSIDEPVYVIRAQLNEKHIIAYGANLALKSGMTLSADIKLEDRSLVEWLLEPIYSLKGRI
jgi:membrane fusion protein